MKSPEQMKTGLTEGIFRVIEKETEGAIEFDRNVWEFATRLVDTVVSAVFGEEDDNEEGMEELCPDMDLFAEE